MSEIQLRLVNQAGELYGQALVLFQRNVALPDDDEVVAWRVFESLRAGEHQSVSFPLDVSLGADDAQGSQAEEHVTMAGQTWMIVDEGGSLAIRPGGGGFDDKVIKVDNQRPSPISVRFSRDGKLLALKPLEPMMTWLFQFPPKVYVGLASMISEGQVMDAATVSSLQATEIDLTGVVSADIVLNADMTFTVENVTR
jgi:hypothetical protein